MSPVKHHVLSAQAALREVKEYIREEQDRLRQYMQELNGVYPPPKEYDPKQKTAHFMYWTYIDVLKDHIVTTEDSITRLIFIKKKILHRIGYLAYV